MLNKDTKIIYIVHAVDTEGPLYESLSATFERINDVFGLNIEATYANLLKLRNQKIDCGNKTAAISNFVSPELLNYNDTWDKIDLMLSKIMSKKFRNKLIDSFGSGWIYNWHCLDHVGYDINPRGRDIGYHNIYDRYIEYLDKYQSKEIDTIQWHFHPMSTYREAHRCATSFENSPHLHQSLCRKIIDRGFFPATFRAGFQTERPDSHWFLEQWIPFDCSNMSIDDPSEFELQNDFKNGRSGDWRRAPSDWSVYHPDIYDYQIPGRCKRSIARFLNIRARIAAFTQEESDKAFNNAVEGKNVLLGLANHDFRDIGEEVEHAREIIRKSIKKYPDVQFKFCQSKDAFNCIINNGIAKELELDVKLYCEDNVYKMKVVEKKGSIFGIQPYLAIKTMGGIYIHDNFDFGLDGKSWYYVFDAETVHSDDLNVVAVAANNKYGNTFIKKIKIADFEEHFNG